MKRYMLLTLVLLLLTGLTTTGAMADGEIVINIVDGRFISNGYDIALAEVAQPVDVGVVNGEVIVRLVTEDGTTREINLGRGQLALTDQAVSYVGLMPEEELTGALPEDMEICDICGRSKAFGYHKTLDCGHYGCLMTLDHLRICSTCGKFTCDSKDHTPCEHCGIGWCSHNDLECEYTRNPSPTPFTTREPDGKITYFVIEEDGSSVQGLPGGAPQTWSPSDEYVEEHRPKNEAGGDGSGMTTMPGGTTTNLIQENG